MGNRAGSIVVSLMGLLSLLAGCSEVPITGRRQLSFVPSSLVNSMSAQQYGQFLTEHKVVSGAPQAETVKRVGARIVQAVNAYCEQYCDEDPFAGFEWEFNLVEDKAINAFAMPGGKVVVYTGILPVTQNDAGLATVMGHEIAHVFADHGGERLSQGLIAQFGGIALSTALKEKPEATQNLFMSAYSVGTQVGLLLPYSRLHENEADRLGMIFMAMAGYDPQEAVGFWQRMSEATGKQAAPPEFLSTHPAPASRIENLRRLVSEAMEYYRKPAGG